MPEDEVSRAISSYRKHHISELLGGEAGDFQNTSSMSMIKRDSIAASKPEIESSATDAVP